MSLTRQSPAVLDEIIVGSQTRGTSEALDNHKAFFFDAQHGILSIPVTERPDNSDRVTAFYVYNVTSTDGFELNGIVDHDTNRTTGFSFVLHRRRTVHCILSLC